MRPHSRLITALALFSLALACSSSSPGAGAPNGDPPTPSAEDKPAPAPEGPRPAPEPGGPDSTTDDALRAAYEKATGEKLDVEDGCIGRTGVKDVVVLGSFAHDRGCRAHHAFVAGQLIDHERLLRDALPLVGWKDMSADERSAFALLWAEKVLFHWGGDFVSESSKAFEFEDTPAFTAPAAVANGDDILVTAWVEQPPGMQDQDNFDLIELRFTADGAITKSVKDGFAVEGSRLR